VSGICTHHLFGSRWNQSLSRALFPAFERQSIVDALHRDAVLHRTHQPAEIASHALVLVDAGDPRRRRAPVRSLRRIQLRDRCHRDPRAACRFHRLRHCVPLDMDALMRAVPARDVTQIAADAGIAIDARDDLIVQVEMLPVRDRRQTASAEILDRGKALLVHPVAQPVDHVLHDPEAVVHRRRAHLHGPAAEQDELRRVAPAAHAAYSGDG
jgi:hypothetical protein